MRELTLGESKELISLLRSYPLVGDIKVTLSTAGDLFLPVMPVTVFDNVTKPQEYPVEICFPYRDVETFVLEYFSQYHIDRRRPRILTNGFEMRLLDSSLSDPVLLKGIVVPPRFKTKGIKK